MSREDIFPKVLSQYCLFMLWWFFMDFSKAFHYPIQLLTFHLFLWKYLLILKMLTETLLRIPFSVIDRCSLVPISADLSWRKCARINLSQLQAASGMILQNHRVLPVNIFSVRNAAVGFLKRVLGRIFKSSNNLSNFKGITQNFKFDLSSTKTQIIV